MTLKWKSSTEAEGVAFKVENVHQIKSCDLKFFDRLNLVIKVEDKWFHKPASQNTITITDAVKKKRRFQFLIFSPPMGESEQTYKVKLNRKPQLVIA